jgi:hypothetical protein
VGCRVGCDVGARTLGANVGTNVGGAEVKGWIMIKKIINITMFTI